MRNFLLIASTLATVAAAIALPAGADTMSFTLTAAGVLSISAPSGDVSLGSQMSLNSASTLTGQLGTVTVSDLRGGSQTWTASVIASSFTPVPTGTAIAASAITYVPGALTFTGGAAGTAVTGVGLAGVTTVVNGSGSGVGTASWNPTISVAVPANFAAGVYTSTITHSVA
jgi:hypothetical protein